MASVRERLQSMKANTTPYRSETTQRSSQSVQDRLNNMKAATRQNVATSAGLVASGSANRVAQMSREDQYRFNQDQTAAGLESVRNNPDFQSVVDRTRGETYRSGNLLTGNADARNAVRDIQLLARQGEGRATDEVDNTVNFMTPEQRDTMLYYAGTNQWDKASEYLDSIRYRLNQQEMQALTERTREVSEANPLLGALTNISAGFLSPVAYGANAVQGIRNAITGENAPTDTNSDLFLGAQLSQASREGVSAAAERMPILGNLEVGGQNLGSFVANTGLSIGQTLSRLPFGAVGALGLAGAGAAGEQTLDILNRGGTQGQAALSGLASGLIEAATEKIGLDNLFSIFGRSGRQGLRTVLQNVARQAGIEASEEAISEALNAVADTAIMGENSNYERSIANYMAQGMTREEATGAANREVLTNIGMAAIGGGLSGGILGGGASVGNYIATRGNTQQDVEMPQRINLQTAEQQMQAQTTPARQTAQTNQQASAGQNNTASTGETVSGLVPITDREAVSLSTGRNNIIARKASDIINFVRNAIQKRGGPERLYMGTIPDSAAQTILDSTGVDVAGYSAILPGDSVQHIVRNHGNERTEAARGNQAVTEEDIALIPQVISSPDSVVLSDRPDVLGRPVLLISKQIGNTYVTAQAVTDGRHALTTNSLWIKKGKNPTPIPDAGMSTNPEGNARSALESSSSENSITQTGQNVNTLKQRQLQQYAPAGNINTQVNENVEGARGVPVSPESTVGAAESGFDPYTHMLNEYGAIPEGENPARVVDVPVSTDGDDRVSRAARTVMEAEATPESMLGDIAEAIANGELSHEVLTDEAAMRQARNIVETEGFANALARFKNQVSRGNGGKNTVALGQVLLNNAMNGGDPRVAIDILTDYATLATQAGQALQAQRIFKKLSPEGQLYGIQRSVLNLQNEMQKRFPDRTITIDPDLIEEFNNQTNQAGRDAVMDKIYQNVADQVPSTWREKWNAWRYMAMLFNPRTHVRNVMGNLLFQPVRVVKDRVASGVEALVGLVNPDFQKTKSFAANPSLYKAAWNDFNNVRDVLSGNKYDDVGAEINRRRTIFNKGPLVKAVERLSGHEFNRGLIETGRVTNSWLLEFEDTIFKRITYADSLAGYLQSNGVTAKQLASGEVNQDLLSRARDYAGQEALRATYQDRNQFSDLLSRRFREDNTAAKVANAAIDAVLPFRRTPANILVRGFEYSPAGLAKALTADLIQVKRGRMSGAEAIDHIAAGLTGSGLFALGAYLLSAGIVTSGGSEDEEQNDLNELIGQQNYALNLPGGGSVTLDWLAPEALPFFMGVELMDAIGEDGFSGLDDIMGALSSISEPMLELSMLQSLNDLIDSVSYAESSGKLVSMAGSALISYLTQAIPTLGGQIERTTEEKRMSSFTDRNSSIPRDVQYAISRSSARLPVDFQQIPYIDAWGRTESSGNILERAFNNLLNPAYTSTVNQTAADEEIQRLLDAGMTGVVPDRVSQSQQVDGEYLNAEEYVEYATVRGQTSYEIVSDMIESDLYQNMTDEQKADAIKRAYQYASHVAAETIRPNHESESYVTAAQQADSAAEYLLLYEKYGSSGTERYTNLMDSGLSSNSAEAVIEAVDGLSGDVTSLQRYRAIVDSGISEDDQMAALSQYMTDSEYRKLSAGYDYGVSPDDYITFRETLPSFDENGNGSFTQAETEAALDSMSGNGLLLFGNTGLTNDQKAVLWQLQGSNWAWRNNPYSTAIGRQVYDLLNSDEEVEEPQRNSLFDLLNLPTG